MFLSAVGYGRGLSGLPLSRGQEKQLGSVVARGARQGNVMRIGLVAFVGLLFAGSAQAQTVERIEITNAGVYRIERGAVEDAPTTALGRFNVIKGQTLVERTTRIPGLLDVNMGMNFQMIGQPKGEPVTIRYVTRFPPQGLRDPKGKVHFTSEVERQHVIGEVLFRSYSFDEPWEIVEGTWTLEFWYRGRMLAAQKFEVVKAEVSADRETEPAADTPSR